MKQWARASPHPREWPREVAARTRRFRMNCGAGAGPSGASGASGLAAIAEANTAAEVGLESLPDAFEGRERRLRSYDGSLQVERLRLPIFEVIAAITAL